VLTDQAVVSGTSFLSNILIARSLGITDYGLFSVVVLVQVFLLSVQQSVSSGIYQVLLPRFKGSMQKFYTNGLFYLQLMFFMLLSVLGAALYSARLSLVEQHHTIFFPSLVAGILFLMQDFLRKILVTQQQPGKALVTDIITNGLQLVLLLFFSFKGTLTLPGALWITGLTFIPSIIAGIYWIGPGWPRLTAIRFTLSHHRNHSGWMFLSALLQWFAGNFFVVAAGWWLGMAALGALRLGQFIFGLLNVLLQAIESYALPRGAVLQKSGDAFSHFLWSIFKKSMIVMLPALILLSVFAKQLLYFSGGNAYTGYAYVMYSLSVIYVVIVAGLPIRIALRVQLLNKNYFIGYLLATAFSLLTAKFLIQEWQLAGVLAGLFVTQVIVLSYWLFILNRKKIITWRLSTSF
jgi:O-antigen/teichoic acid export membrane protein